MQKCIILLNGKNEGKTFLIETLKENDYWVWNVNYKNVLSMVAHKVGYDGTKSKEFYDFIEEFKVLANRYFSSESWYIDMMIDKFYESQKAQILIVHGASPEISADLQNKYNAFTINITTSDENIENNVKYCKCLNCNHENYKQEILDCIQIMTKDFQKENE